MRLFLGCVVVAAGWVWWVGDTKKEPLVKEQAGVTIMVRSSAGDFGPVISGTLTVDDGPCLGMEMSAAP